MKKEFVIILVLCGLHTSAHLQIQFWPFTKTPREIIHEGNIHYANGEYSEARDKYEKIALANPGNPYAAYNIGSAAYKEKDYNNAIRYYENALSKVDDPTLKENLYYNMGNAYYEKGEVDKAIESYKETLKMNPKHENARYNLSYALKEKKKNEPPPSNQPQGEPPPQPQMNEKEAENILDNLDNKEKELRKQMNKNASRNGKEKDW